MYLVIFLLKSIKRRSASRSVKKISALLNTTFVVYFEQRVGCVDWGIKTNSEFSNELHVELSLQVAHSRRYQCHLFSLSPSHSEDHRVTETNLTNACTHSNPNSLFLSHPSSSFSSSCSQPPPNHPQTTLFPLRAK